MKTNINLSSLVSFQIESVFYDPVLKVYLIDVFDDANCDQLSYYHTDFREALNRFAAHTSDYKHSTIVDTQYEFISNHNLKLTIVYLETKRDLRNPFKTIPETQVSGTLISSEPSNGDIQDLLDDINLN